MSTPSREFDLLLWGASGFTGQLVARYLASRSSALPNFKWALGGRSGTRLEAVRAGLGVGFEALPLVVADSHDASALNALAARSLVVVTTVGPYALYGSELVRACAEQGTDYCDLAGETQWIRQMIEQHSATARDSGARLVHCCGFDSVPFDMGVWAVQQAMQERHGTYSASVSGLMRRMKGSFSGGTYASMLNLMKEASTNRTLRRQLPNVAMLLPDVETFIPQPASESRVQWCAEANSWTAPFVMSPVNSRIVQRTHSLLGKPWADDFEYAEGVATGPGMRGRAAATAMLAGTGGFMLVAALGPTRALLTRLMPSPGEGPDEQARAAGYYEAEFIARHPSQRDRDVHLTVRGDMDPGYGSTSKIIAECGLALAIDELEAPGGSWTPASVMGPALLARLQQFAGLSFESREES